MLTLNLESWGGMGAARMGSNLGMDTVVLDRVSHCSKSSKELHNLH